MRCELSSYGLNANSSLLRTRKRSWLPPNSAIFLKLEGDERKVQEVVTSDLLFDVSAEQFALPEGFDWSAFPASYETPVEAPGSSQGS